VHILDNQCQRASDAGAPEHFQISGVDPAACHSLRQWRLLNLAANPASQQRRQDIGSQVVEGVDERKIRY
jgi:hypothetical protein